MIGLSRRCNMILKRSALLLILIFLPTAAFAAKRYVVKKGDNLGNLAKKLRVSIQSIKKTNSLKTNGFCISVEKIKHVNGLTDNGLKTGMILTIPESRHKDLDNMISLHPADIELKEVSPYKYREYVVKNGDSLTSIAGGFGISVTDLKNANGLSSDEVRIGMKLIIPDSQIPMRVVRVSPNLSDISNYVVKKGDTLSIIASKYRVSVRELKSVNDMRDDKVKVGMRLIIPNSNLSKNVESKTPVISDNNKYVVQKGDSISSIAKRYGVSQVELKRANNIKGNTIESGQLLRVPSMINVKDELVIEDIKVAKDDTHIKSLPEIETAKAIQSNESSTYENGLTRDVIISIAKRFLGAHYKVGGNSLIRGLDCSAFVNKVFSFFNVDLPRTAREMYKIGRNVTKGELSAGGLGVFWTYASYPSHVGIYIGDSEFIHASSAAKRVRIDKMNQSYYRKRYIGAKRIVSAGIFYEELSKDYKGFETQ